MIGNERHYFSLFIISAGSISMSSTRQMTLTDPYRRMSVDQFSQTSVSNEVLKSLRYLMQVNKGKTTAKKLKGNEPFNWGQLDAVLFARNVITICTQVKEFFRNEPRLLEIQAPAYVMGQYNLQLVFWIYSDKYYY